MEKEADQEASLKQLRRDLWMAALAVVSIAIGLYGMGQPKDQMGMSWLDYVDLAIVGVFIVDFVLAVRATGSLRRVLRERWWELPSMIPITGGMIGGMEGISLIRGVRLLRLVRVVRLLRVVSIALRFRRQAFFIAQVYRRSKAGSILTFAAVIILLGAVAAFAAESRYNPRFGAFKDSLWWSLNMFTNVAYVDFQPVTGACRLVAGILQILGIAFIGIFAGSMANAIMQETKAEESKPADAHRDSTRT